ncbi:MAG: DUF7210 family protein [Gammaproteobacteria bacterium]
MTTPEQTEGTALIKVSVTLKQHHTHAGKPKKPGEQIDVTPSQRDWLARRGIVEQP